MYKKYRALFDTKIIIYKLSLLLHINNKAKISLKMIRQILYAARSRKQLYKNKLVCGCVYRSFNDLQATVFFKFATQGGKAARHHLFDMIPADKQKQKTAYAIGTQRLMDVVKTFLDLEIIIKTSDNYTWELYHEFVRNVQEFIKSPYILPSVQMNNKPISYEPQPFEFLQILFEDRLPKKCKITGLNEYATHLTRDQFIYIKSDISYKIRILIDGIINSREVDNTKNIEIIILLNLLDSDEYYQRNQRLNPILEELAKIKLVQFAGERDQYFRISKYLENFTFRSTKQRQINTKLNCRIIIETNFKVFVVIESHNPRENKVINKILSMLLKSQKEGVQYEELFIGQIQQEFMKNEIFNKTKITTFEYFEMFKQYTDDSTNLPKDLGKWKKLKYIGLEGPSQQSNIPNNVKQEVKLWQHLKDEGNKSRE